MESYEISKSWLTNRLRLEPHDAEWAWAVEQLELVPKGGLNVERV